MPPQPVTLTDVQLPSVEGGSPGLRGVLGVPEGRGPWSGVVLVHEACCLVATFRALRAGEGRAFIDIESARDALRSRDDSTGRVGVLGFCMGGGFALAAAAGHGFTVSSVNYGMLRRDLDDDLRGACPIVGSYGARDLSLRGATAKLEGALTRLGVPHDLKEPDRTRKPPPTRGSASRRSSRSTSAGVSPAPARCPLRSTRGCGR